MTPLIEELRHFADGQDDYIAGLCNRAADAIEGKLTFDLHDPMSELPHEEAPSVSCRITADQVGIYLRPDGYGDCDSADKNGCPAMIEFFNGEVRVVVWPDINSDEPTIISLEGAKESERENEDNDTSPDQGDDNG